MVGVVPNGTALMREVEVERIFEVTTEAQMVLKTLSVGL